MISRTNYFEATKKIDFSKVPESLKKAHEYVLKASRNGTNWDIDQRPGIKKVVDETIKKLNELTATFEVTKERPVKTETTLPQSNERPTPARAAEIKSSSSNVKKHSRAKKSREIREDEENYFELVERIPDEIKFLRRFIGLYGKRKTKEELLRFINALHKAMLEKRIRKTSPYANQIMIIQDKLVKTFNTMTKATVVPISDEVLEEFKELIKSEKVYPSIQLIKRYVNLNGKFGVKDKARQLMEAMSRAFEKGRVEKSDKYYKVFDRMHLNLSKYVKNKSQKILTIHEAELNGLDGLLGGFNNSPSNRESQVNGLDGIDQLEVENPAVMSVAQAKAAKFDTIGLTGPYLAVIGEACRPTHLFAYGNGGSGKSSFMLRYCEFLNKLGYKVLYIAGEQFNTPTFTKLLNDLNINANENFEIVKDLNTRNLKNYEFVALDSKDSLGIEVEDFKQLKELYPEQSFIISSQGTKAGDYTGSGKWLNEIDTMIYCEAGIARTGNEKNRWGGQGEMRIFGDVNQKLAA